VLRRTAAAAPSPTQPNPAQGQFKRPVRCDSLIMGADFQQPLRLPPKLWMAGTRLGSWIARRAGGNLSVRLRGPKPFAHSRVITAAQVGRGVELYPRRGGFLAGFAARLQLGSGEPRWTPP
jgi:hypothetical protein